MPSSLKKPLREEGAVTNFNTKAYVHGQTHKNVTFMFLCVILFERLTQEEWEEQLCST